LQSGHQRLEVRFLLANLLVDLVQPCLVLSGPGWVVGRQQQGLALASQGDDSAPQRTGLWGRGGQDGQVTPFVDARQDRLALPHGGVSVCWVLSRDGKVDV